MEYFFCDGSPAVVIGKHYCLTPDSPTGAFRWNTRMMSRLRSHDSWVDSYDREGFIQELESWRAKNLSKDAAPDDPIFVLYQMITDVQEVAQEQGRPLTDDEKALIWNLRTRTHEMFEERLAAAQLTGLPGPDGTMEFPPLRGPQPIPPEWRALDEADIAMLIQRVRRLSGPLSAGDLETAAAVLGWPVTGPYGEGATLDSGLPLREPSATLSLDRGRLSLYVLITDNVENSATGEKFAQDAFEVAERTAQAMLGAPRASTGGHWPEILWLADGVGIFLRRSSGYAALLAMPEADALDRLRAVAEETRWE
jgi:hypothetical protein